MPRFLMNPLFRPGGHPSLPGSAPAEFHARLPGYAPSPLVRSRSLETVHGIERIWVKDESSRFGLPAFKVLGASWAVYRTACERLGRVPEGWSTFEELRDAFRPLLPLRLVTATDGNHGRAVARVAKMFGFEARIFMPAGSAEARVAAIQSEGAAVTVIDGSYDDAVDLAKTEAGPRSLVISDTSWDGYTTIPALVAEGYETIFAEADRQLAAAGELPPTHVFVQIGVGALAMATVDHFRGRATVIGVEPAASDHVRQSVEAGRIVEVPGPHTSVMAGLNCGVQSQIAWPIMRDGITAFVGVEDAGTLDAMRVLAEDGIVSGETGASGAAGLVTVARTGSQHAGLTPASRVLLISTEGATDPAFYERVTGRRP